MAKAKKNIMRRYIKNIELQLPTNEVEEEVHSFLEKNEFYEAVWKGERCFTADALGATDGLFRNLKKVYFFRYTYKDGFFYIEAWIREGKNSEMKLSGLGGSDIKQPYLAKILDFEKRMIEKIPKDSALYGQNSQMMQNVMKQHTKSVKIYQYIVAIALLIFIILVQRKPYDLPDFASTAMPSIDDAAAVRERSIEDAGADFVFHDEEGRVYLEFFMDEEGNCGYGIKYSYETESGELESIQEFSVDEIGLKEWADRDYYATVSYQEKITGEESVANFQEMAERDEEGRIVGYTSTGKINALEQSETETIIEMEFFYHSDGSLQQRLYYGNPYVFGSAFGSVQSVFDEQERLIYEKAYLTHGSLEYFYFYESDSKIPEYGIQIDNNANTLLAEAYQLSFSVEKACGDYKVEAIKKAKFYYTEYNMYYLESDETSLPPASLIPHAEREKADYLLDYAIFSEDIFCLYGRKSTSEEEEHFGYADSAGRLIADTEYDFAYPFSEGMGCVMKEGRYGFLDKNGEVAIPVQYLDAAPFSDGLAYFCTEDNYGFMDKNGQPVFLLDCDSVSSFREGMAYFSIEGKYGFLNKEGETVIEAIYDDADYFEDGIAIVRKNCFMGVIDTQGKEIVPAEYVYIVRGEGVLACWLDNGECDYYCFSGDKTTEDEYEKRLEERVDNGLSYEEAKKGIPAARILFTNKITPQKELYWNLASGISVTVQTEEGNMRQEQKFYSGEADYYRKIFKLFSVKGMKEPILYCKEEPFRHFDMRFPLSDNAFYGISENHSLKILLTGYESGGSARGDWVCFFWDKETDEVLSGVAGEAGGSAGFSNWKTIYEVWDDEMKIKESVFWIGQTSGNYSEEELLENAEHFYDEEDNPYTKETILEALSVNEYKVNGQPCTPGLYRESYGRYREIEILDWN